MTAGRERRLAQVCGPRGNRELRALYDGWAADYDEDLRDFGSTDPALLAGLVARHVRELREPVLDAGVGTGIIGEMLYALGYEQLVGIDLSDGMLAVARRKAIYAELGNQTLGQPLDFADDRFGVTILAGVLTIGHAPPHGFSDELVRVTPPGGYVIFTLTTPVYEGGGFKEKVAALAAAGRWRQHDLSRPLLALPRAPAEHAHWATSLQSVA